MNNKPSLIDETEIESISFWQAFKFWLKLGFISFGGPAGQIAVMHQELVEEKKWISEQRFMHALEKTGLTQAEFAARLHISARTLQNWEQGRRYPTGPAATLIRILDAHPTLI